VNVVWILVYIVVVGSEPMAINAMGPRVTFTDMYECFAARESLSNQVGQGNGYFHNNQQAVCIPVDNTDT